KSQQARSKEATIVGDPLIVKKMIDYLYREDYDDTPELTIEEQNRSSPEQVGTTGMEGKIL
ncbi:hypothetical protein BDV37DRAFT_266351, partial [Aspergillus pseudonomiae]